MTTSDADRDRLNHVLARVAQGDVAALGALYDLTSAKLFGVSLRICGDRQAAEDVLHDVYLLVWRRADRYEAGRASPITWLSTITRNRAIDWRRSRSVRDSAPIDVAADLPDTAPRADTILEQAEDRSRLQTCLDMLEVKQRTAIRTAYFEGVTYADLATRDDVPLGTMKSWIRRGLAKLKLCLEA